MIKPLWNLCFNFVCCFCFCAVLLCKFNYVVSIFSCCVPVCCMFCTALLWTLVLRRCYANMFWWLIHDVNWLFWSYMMITMASQQERGADVLRLRERLSDLRRLERVSAAGADADRLARCRAVWWVWWVSTQNTRGRDTTISIKQKDICASCVSDGAKYFEQNCFPFFLIRFQQNCLEFVIFSKGRFAGSAGKRFAHVGNSGSRRELSDSILLKLGSQVPKVDKNE